MATFEHSIRLGKNVKIVLSLAIILSLFTSNPVLTIVAILFIPIAIKLLWKKNEPPILFAAIILQWLQVTVKVFLADFSGLDYKVFFTAPDQIISAFYLSLIALLVLSLGIYASLNKYKGNFTLRVETLKNLYNHKSVIYVYGIFIISRNY